MLHYGVYLHLHELLGRISALTPLLRQAGGRYARAAEQYLNDLQAFADAQRLPIASDIAVALQKLLSSDAKNEPHRSSSKVRDALAAECVARVQEKTADYLSRYEKLFDECADACRQLAAQVAAFHDGTLGVNPADSILSAARSSDSLRPYYARLVGTVGVFNLRAILENILPQAGILS